MDIIGIAGAGLVSGAVMAAAIDPAHVDDSSFVSMRIAASVAVSVFVCGMWISRKLTHLEDTIGNNNEARIAALASIERRIENVERTLERLPCGIRVCNHVDRK
jgi:hypothetical protein